MDNIPQKHCKVDGCTNLGKYNKRVNKYYYSKQGYCVYHQYRLDKYGNVNAKTRNDKRAAVIEGKIAKVPLGLNAKYGFSIIDSDKVDIVNKYNWRMNSHGYAEVKIGKNAFIKLHRLVIDRLNDTDPVDHINGNKLDNRLNNLRICTVSQNMLNVPARNNNKLGYKGVCINRKNKCKRYQATITMYGVTIYLGGFYTAEDAALAYDCAAVQLHGEFAKTNIL